MIRAPVKRAAGEDTLVVTVAATRRDLPGTQRRRPLTVSRVRRDVLGQVVRRQCIRPGAIARLPATMAFGPGCHEVRSGPAHAARAGS